MGVTERRQREREARKQAILEAAQEVFGREGYDDAPMEVIAERAGVNIATVYYYYASKEILYLAVLATAMEDMLPALVRAAQGEGTVRDRLRSMVAAYTEFYDRHPDLLLVAGYLGSRSNGNGDASEARNLARQALTAACRARDITAGALVEGRRRGELREVDADRTVVLMWASLTGLLQVSNALRRLDRSALLEEWLDLTVCGLSQPHA